MTARFIFVETIVAYEHTAPRFVTKDIEIPDDFVPKCEQYPKSDMDLRGVELIKTAAKMDSEQSAEGML